VASCPACNTPLDGDEIFCLQCGTRLVPEPEPEQSWTVPAVIIGAIALIAVGAVFFALRQVESDAEREAAEPVEVVERGGGSGGRIAEWPAGKSAYTVVLAQAPNETIVRTQATAALRAGIPAGVLESDRYPTLEPGTWVLFAGRFESLAEAVAATERYAEAGFPDAEPRYVGDEEPAG
jgi:hypothetical protein